MNISENCQNDSGKRPPLASAQNENALPKITNSKKNNSATKRSIFKPYYGLDELNHGLKRAELLKVSVSLVKKDCRVDLRSF